MILNNSLTHLESKMYHSFKYTHKSQAGYTLLELLVGSFIGLFLVAGMGQMYLSGKQTYNISQSVGRAQEDLRFAYHFITRDVRETSFTGCMRTVRNMTPAADRNSLNDLNIKIAGWDHDNTSPGDDAIVLNTNYSVSTARNDWSGLSVNGSTDLPDFIDSVPNSDVLMVRAVTPLDGATISGSGDITLTTNLSLDSADVTAGDVLVVGSCRVADQFVVASPAGGSVTSTASSFREDWGPDSRAVSISNTFYYIGLRNGAETPSLFRVNITPNGPEGPAQELVEGVESMQVLYGIDITDDEQLDANRYVSADDVADFRQVVSTRLGLILVQPDGRTPSVANAETVTYNAIDDLDYVTELGDASLRFSSTATIKTRNLGLASAFSISVCNADAPTTAGIQCNGDGFIVLAPAP